MTTSLRNLFDARLARVLERLEREAKTIRDECEKDPKDPVSIAWQPDAAALEYAVAEIRAEMGMEKSDEAAMVSLMRIREIHWELDLELLIYEETMEAQKDGRIS